MYTDIFSFGERILLDFDTHDVGLSNSNMKLRRCVFNKVFLVNHWGNCSCKWLCLSNSYRYIGPKPRLSFPCNENILFKM